MLTPEQVADGWIEGPDGFAKLTVTLTEHNLPTGHLWEDDGACWRAILCDHRIFGCKWRWQPMNWYAFSKGEPTGEMYRHIAYKPENDHA